MLTAAFFFFFFRQKSAPKEQNPASNNPLIQEPSVISGDGAGCLSPDSPNTARGQPQHGGTTTPYGGPGGCSTRDSTAGTACLHPGSWGSKAPGLSSAAPAKKLSVRSSEEVLHSSSTTWVILTSLPFLSLLRNEKEKEAAEVSHVKGKGVRVTLHFFPLRARSISKRNNCSGKISSK